MEYNLQKYIISTNTLKYDDEKIQKLRDAGHYFAVFWEFLCSSAFMYSCALYNLSVASLTVGEEEWVGVGMGPPF